MSGGRIGRAVAVCGALLLWSAHAEQLKTFGDWQIHYVAFNATLLPVQVAERYGIVRGPRKGLLNVTAVGASGRGEAVALSGRFLNLLGQAQPLAFREIDDNGTIYYLAAFDFENAETLRFEVDLELPGHGGAELRFQQPLYVPYP